MAVSVLSIVSFLIHAALMIAAMVAGFAGSFLPPATHMSSSFGSQQKSVVSGQSTAFGPALAANYSSVGGGDGNQIVAAWAAKDSGVIHFGKMKSDDKSLQLSKVTSTSFVSADQPALTYDARNNTFICAWRDKQDEILLARSANGLKWKAGSRTELNIKSPSAPALTLFKNKIVVATRTPQHGLSVISEKKPGKGTFKTTSALQKYHTRAGPSVAVVVMPSTGKERLYMTWTRYEDARVIVTYSDDLKKYVDAFEIADETTGSTPTITHIPFATGFVAGLLPFLAPSGGELMLSWQGADSQVNFLFTPVTSSDTAAAWEKGRKETIQEKTQRAIGLVTTGSVMAMAWAGADEKMSLNIAEFVGGRGLQYWMSELRIWCERSYEMALTLKVPKYKTVKKFWFPKLGKVRMYGPNGITKPM